MGKVEDFIKGLEDMIAGFEEDIREYTVNRHTDEDGVQDDDLLDFEDPLDFLESVEPYDTCDSDLVDSGAMNTVWVVKHFISEYKKANGLTN